MVTMLISRHSNLILRTISACLLISLSLWVLLSGDIHVKNVTISLFFILMAYEWGEMSKVHLAQWSTPLFMLLLILLCLSPIPTPVAMALFIPFLFLYRGHSVYLGGLIYISLACISFLHLAQGSMYLFLWMLFIAWTGDIFAYFSGKTFGGPKLCPAISPGKTWSGLVGGVIFATILGGIFAWIMDLSAFPFIMSCFLSLIGHGGDLLESAAKRHFDVKDSSNLIPGHGGVLDRLDSLLPMAMILAVMFM